MRVERDPVVVHQEVQVTVTTPGGTSATGSHTSYTYVPAPTVMTLTPAQGPSTGGNLVTIKGANFTNTTDVLFGAAPASFSIVSDTQIVAAAPPGSGSVSVTAASAGGSSSPGVAYTYL
ncbi:IPT/TIG domain-containing protein [Planotetraspora sp. A-T 1434]|uniref:IPT/TIG domain-containing protein n=1 Tax=Planotetraspora sp. A-T 1434 TaxID=2979219 RepID=UPI0021C19C53|nr:IPT/TIG domain-containing protein [Planotetraspora sp. A-T 1434]MCT9932808.1 IPT/TIG domain-containing protein [Planotetraspora sp. A-T 1434]